MSTLNSKIPVTVLTGFLGSGKTTLLNRILSENHGLRIAVIENEFGEVGVDQDLVINADEEILEMNNGCICCTVRGDLIRILASLAKRRQKFDRVLIETTGMANPGPVAQTFFVNDDVRNLYVLDGIVTLVDAVHLPQQLGRNPEVFEQLAFADVVVLNKLDLVPGAVAEELERRVHKLNSLARVVRSAPTGRAQVPLETVLGIGGFDLARTDEGPMLDAGEAISLGKRVQLPAPSGSAGFQFGISVTSAGRYWLFTQHRPEEFNLQLIESNESPILPKEQRQFNPSHSHDDGVGSISFETVRALDFQKFQRWMSEVLGQYGTTLYRFKGVLNVAGTDRRLVVQGVHMLVDSTSEPWGGRERRTRLVLIGRSLPQEVLMAGFERCLA